MLQHFAQAHLGFCVWIIFGRPQPGWNRNLSQLLDMYQMKKGRQCHGCFGLNQFFKVRLVKNEREINKKIKKHEYYQEPKGE